MRTRIEVRWFKTCATVAQVNELYKKLVMQHHPDRGGDLHAMQEINAERDAIMKNPSMLGVGNAEPFSAGRWTRGNSGNGKRRNSNSRDAGLSAGKYTVRITGYRENKEKKYVALIFDIDEGEHAGHFATKPWYRHCIYLSYKTDWQYDKAERICRMFSASNAGFDAMRAFCDDGSRKFIGKVVGVKLTDRYIGGDGFIDDSEVYAV